MNNEDRVLSILESVRIGVPELKAGQTKLEADVGEFKVGVSALENSQKLDSRLLDRILALEKFVDDMRSLLRQLASV